MQIEKNPAAEIVNQHAVHKQMFPARSLSSVIGYSLMALFLPLWICVLAFTIDVVAAAISIRIMQNIDPARQRSRYNTVILAIVITELAFAIPVMLLWQLDAPYAKVLAVGLISSTTFQIASVRSVHLTFGIAALVTVVATTLFGNAVYWLGINDFHGLAISTIGILSATYYFTSAMFSSHALHSELTLRGEAARTASLAKGRFIAQISHELRTPLNAIIGMGVAEQAAAQNPASAERMQVLVSSAKGLAVILDDILDMSALEGKGVTIRPKPVTLTDELSYTATLYRAQFEAAGLTLRFSYAPNLPKTLLLDAPRLRQCLSNLLSNALKFTDQGGVVVKASMRGDMLLIDVQDTGRGIPKDEADQLFLYFQRGSDAQSGTGLGLAISRGLARQMGGDLEWIASPIGAHFRLSVKTSPASAAAVTEPAGWVISQTPMTVLVVDDIATNRLVASTYLQGLGFIAIEAASGAEALELLATTRIDLILLDMNMPQMSGLECFSQIRTQSPNPIPVLAMTANADHLHQDVYAAAGLDGFLAKPLTPETVRAALSAHLPLTSAA